MMRAILCTVDVLKTPRKVLGRKKATFWANSIGKTHLSYNCMHTDCNKVRAFVTRGIVKFDDAQGKYTYAPIVKKSTSGVVTFDGAAGAGVSVGFEVPNAQNGN